MSCSFTEKDIAAQMLDSLYVSLDWCNSTLLPLHHPSCNLCNFSLWCGVALLTSRDTCFGGRCQSCQWLWLVNRPVTAAQHVFHGSADTQFPKE